MAKKSWEKPELIVVVRSRPEEAVLWTCKNRSTGPHSGSDAFDLSCRYDYPWGHNCDTCEGGDKT
jgi:hypothetical protein